MFKQVKKMHEYFSITSPALKEIHEFALFRSTAMIEEVLEFQRSILKSDQAAELDALVDLAVFLMGTVELLGWSEEQFEEAYNRVMAANMKKVVAHSSGIISKRGYKKDLVKPEGWKAADLTDIVDGTWTKNSE